MIYAYRCKSCGHEFTVRATLAEKGRGLDLTCPSCGETKEIVQDFRGVGLAFGGSGRSPAPFGGGCLPGGGCCG